MRRNIRELGPLRVLSLGGGVQSTALALMANNRAHGLKPPDCAIFADTGWEPRAVYENLDRLESVLEFPLYRVSAGNIRDAIVGTANRTSGRAFVAIPFYLQGGGIGRRQCTAQFKVKPIVRRARDLIGYKSRSLIPVGAVEMWIGISRDEAHRMKPSRFNWIRNQWPLVELGLRREQCVAYLAGLGWQPVRSACIGCPFHSDREWKAMRDERPDEWRDAVEIDLVVRTMPKMKAAQFMHRSRVPLSDVDLRTAEDHGQGNLFGNECEGMCGV